MLMLAQGVPLLWSGDEMGNSQNGNNNAYCQDNPTGWVNWKNEKSHRRQIEFLQQVIAFRKKNIPCFQIRCHSSFRIINRWGIRIFPITGQVRGC